jgi:hypothetical protein
MKHLTLSALFKCAPRAIIVAWISLASGLAAPPEARSEPGSGTIADQESIFIDGQTFLERGGPDRGDGLAVGAEDAPVSLRFFRSAGGP